MELPRVAEPQLDGGLIGLLLVGGMLTLSAIGSLTVVKWIVNAFLGWE